MVTCSLSRPIKIGLVLPTWTELNFCFYVIVTTRELRFLEECFFSYQLGVGLFLSMFSRSNLVVIFFYICSPCASFYLALTLFV